VNGTSWDKKSRAIVSTSYINTNDDKVITLAVQIIDRIKAKTTKLAAAK